MSNRIGQQLGNYLLIRLLGRGGFADVYLAEHIYLKTLAAIKILHTQLQGEELKGFLHEAQTIARLRHPNIVRILDFGVDGTENTPYLVMDLASNGTLRQCHPKGSIVSLATVISYVKQIAAALQYAHDERLIHRDVKPENMLLGSNNEVLLSDFGIAALAHGTFSLKTQEYAGTVQYSAPEQIQGKPRPASDQYALGIIIYEWLCGNRPFEGGVVELIGQHLHAFPPLLSERVPTLSSTVEQVVMKSLAKDPEKRFASVREFVQALEQGALKEQWLKDGNAHVLALQYREAIADYDRVLELDPKDAHAYRNRGTAYLLLGEYRRAIDSYDHALDLNPQDPRAYSNRGNAYKELKEYEKALADYDHAVTLNPEDALVYHNRGDIYDLLNDNQRAIAEFDHSIELDPNLAAPYAGRGAVYRRLKQYQQAIQDLDYAIELDHNPTIFDHNPTFAYHNRGDIYFELQEYRKAIDDYDHAVTLNSEDALAYRKRGNAYVELQEYQKAIEDYNRALELDPKDALAYLNRGDTYCLLQEYRKAIEDYNNALKLNPGDTWAKAQREEAYRRLRRHG